MLYATLKCTFYIILCCSTIIIIIIVDYCYSYDYRYNYYNYYYYREHIYGFTSDLFTNNTIYSLPLAPASYSGRGGPSSSNTGCSLVYSAGSTGLVHDLVTNTQRHYTGTSWLDYIFIDRLLNHIYAL